MATRESPRAYRIVVDEIEGAILDGSLTAGESLPPERELANQLGVSRTAVREAIRSLQAQGVVASEVGSRGGTRVTAMSGQALTRLLRLHAALARFPVSDLTEVRVALERTAARAAAESHTPSALRQLRAILDAAAQCTDPDAFNELDTEFHLTLAGVGNNQLATELTVAVREALRDPILAAEHDLDSWPEFRASLMRQHERILAAVDAGDPAGAEAAMEAHIRTAYSILRSVRQGSTRR